MITSSANIWSTPGEGAGGEVGAGTSGQIAIYGAANTVTGNTRLTDNGTTLAYSGAGGISSPILTSTVAIGTAPLVVTSTTVVANLNVSLLGGATFAAPGTIGGTTAAAATFTTATVTTLTASGVISTSLSPAVSQSAVLVSGAPQTAGSGTTNFPLVYINDGSAPSTFNAAGTVLGINAPSGFAGSMLDFHVNGGGLTTRIGYNGIITTIGAIQAPTYQNSNNNHTFYSGTAPTIASGFGTTPSIPANNGTAAFTVNVGTGGTATSGVITMPAATTGWACHAAPNGAPQAAAVTYSAPTSTTSITLTNYTLTTGAALAWTTGTVLQVSCFGY